MTEMMDKLGEIWPEMVLLITACICLAMGLTKSIAVRKATVGVAAAGLVLALVLAVTPFGDAENVQWTMATFVKAAVAGVGLLLLAVAASVPDHLRMTRDAERGVAKFDPSHVMRGEFFAFFLISLTGVMLTAGAGDLAWLFLALELTSLPTYVMVATSRDESSAQESAVKYFFLGAMSAATFLYGFAFIYGATGYTDFASIREYVIMHGVSPIMMLGIVLSVLGLAFKIAAVPMHAYAADVYQGATTPVTTFLAFVPKTAGFVAMLLLLGLVRDLPGQPNLPAGVATVLVVIAALTMTLGNVLGLLQTSVKRILAYSSVAHSGYMLMGVIAGMSMGPASGAGAVLFYLVAYGLGTIGAFAVLGSLERDGQEADDLRDLEGLSRRRPVLAAVMLLSMLSLFGIPPLIGFFGKVYLFMAAVEAGYIGLVIVAVVNTAISGVYYLRIASACYFGKPNESVQVTESIWRPLAGGVAAVLALVLGLMPGFLVGTTGQATSQRSEGEAFIPSSTPATAELHERITPTGDADVSADDRSGDLHSLVNAVATIDPPTTDARAN